MTSDDRSVNAPDAQEPPVDPTIESADIAQRTNASALNADAGENDPGDPNPQPATSTADQHFVRASQPVSEAGFEAEIEAGDGDQDAETKPVGPAELYDVPIARPVSRGAVMIVLMQILYFAIWTAIVFVAVTYGLTGPWTIGLWIGGMFVWGILVSLLKARRARTRADAFVAENIEDLAYGRYREVVARFANVRGFARADTLSNIAAAIGGMQIGNLAIRMGQPNRLSAIRPLGVQFEPRPLDGLLDWTIEGAELPHAVGGEAGGGGSTTIRERGGLITRFLQSAWASVAILLVFWIPGAIAAFRSGRPRGTFLIISVFLLLSLRQAFRTRAQVQGTTWRQGFVVPGGLVFRKSANGQPRDAEGKYVTGTWTVHLFDRRESVLFIYQRTIDRWVVQVGDFASTATVEMNRLECDRLLAAWLSPLPTPTVEQLTDLA